MTEQKIRLAAAHHIECAIDSLDKATRCLRIIREYEDLDARLARLRDWLKENPQGE